MLVGDLFSWQPSYPANAGWKGNDASRAGAKKADKARGKIQDLVYAAFVQLGEADAWTISEMIDKSITTVRSRISELAAREILFDTGRQRMDTPTGVVATIWGLSKPRKEQHEHSPQN